jgi:hypothetical protein
MIRSSNFYFIASQCILVIIIFLISVFQLYENNMFYFETFLEKKDECEPSSNAPIQNFTIVGERCTGTFFLQHAIEKNFCVPVTWKYGWKHWFGHHTDYSNSDNTLFLAMYRHPLDWMNSLFRDQHHLQKKMRHKENFLRDPIINIDWTRENIEIDNTRNLETGNIYKNIFELRAVKLKYLLNDFPKTAKNVEIFSLEDFKKNYTKILLHLQKKYKLKRKHSKIQTIDYHLVGGKIRKHTPTKTFTIEDIKPYLDLETEKKAGYLI